MILTKFSQFSDAYYRTKFPEPIRSGLNAACISGVRRLPCLFLVVGN